MYIGWNVLSAVVSVVVAVPVSVVAAVLHPVIPSAAASNTAIICRRFMLIPPVSSSEDFCIVITDSLSHFPDY